MFGVKFKINLLEFNASDVFKCTARPNGVCVALVGFAAKVTNGVVMVTAGCCVLFAPCGSLLHHFQYAEVVSGKSFGACVGRVVVDVV